MNFSYLGVQKSVRMGTMTMLVCNMDHSAYALTLDHKETVRKGNALTVVQATTTSKCVEALDTSIFFILMHTRPQLMIGAAGALLRTYTTKNGMLTWINVVQQVSSHSVGYKLEYSNIKCYKSSPF